MVARQARPHPGRRASTHSMAVLGPTMSLGMSTSTGPGRPVAMWNAWRMARGCPRAGDQLVVLGDRPGDADDVALLEGVGAADRRAGTWPVMTTMGTESMNAPQIGVTMLVAPDQRSPWPRRVGRWRARPRPCDPRPARGARARDGSGCRGSGRTPAGSPRREDRRSPRTPSSSRALMRADPPLVFMLLGPSVWKSVSGSVLAVGLSWLWVCPGCGSGLKTGTTPRREVVAHTRRGPGRDA